MFLPNFNQKSWFVCKKHDGRSRTAQIANSKRTLSSYGEYRARQYATINGSINNQKNKETEDIVVPISRIVEEKFKQYYKREPQSVGYTKSERSNYLFEKIVMNHPALKIFENLKVLHEDLLSTAHKIVSVNKQGKSWDYLLLATIHVVLFQHNRTDFMPNLPYFWKTFKTTSFHWKTYQTHLLFLLSNIQPLIRNGQLLTKKPEAWLQELTIWYEGISHPNKSIKLIQNLSISIPLSSIDKTIHQPIA